MGKHTARVPAGNDYPGDRPGPKRANPTHRVQPVHASTAHATLTAEYRAQGIDPALIDIVAQRPLQQQPERPAPRFTIRRFKHITVSNPWYIKDARRPAFLGRAATHAEAIAAVDALAKPVTSDGMIGVMY